MLKRLSQIKAIQRTVGRVFTQRSVWECPCGYKIPKTAAVVSGDDRSSQGFHVHCPNCGRVVAQFVDPKRVGE